MMTDIRKICWSMLWLLPFAGMAQIQHGYVKTRGRLDHSGVVRAGSPIANAVISVKGLNNVVSQSDGTFSVAIRSDKFYIQDVRKSGYVLTDPEILSRQHLYSATPLVIVLEPPNERAAAQLAAERKIRRTLQQQLQQREDEIEALKEQNRITEEEYNRALEKLYADQSSNERLISEMAQRYAQIDYDQLSDGERQMSEYILNGELAKADSLLNAKGDIQADISTYLQLQDANKKERETIRQRQERLAQSEAYLQFQRDDLAQRCYEKFEINRLRHRNDSAAYYIDQRCDLDTTNMDWMLSAATFHAKQNDVEKATSYYNRIIAYSREQASVAPETYRPYLASALNNLAILCASTNQQAKSEELYRETLSIRQQLAEENPRAYTEAVAQTLNNLALLYSDTQRTLESELMFKEVLGVRRQLATDDPQRYLPDVAVTLNNIASLYLLTHRTYEGGQAYLEALAIYQQLSANDSTAYQADIAAIENNLAAVCYQGRQLEESRSHYLTALSVYSRLAKDNPQAYDPYVKEMLRRLPLLYSQKDEHDYLGMLAVYRMLANDNPQEYTPKVAQMLNTLADYYDKSGTTAKSESLYQEALDIYKQLAVQNPQQYTPYVARGLGNLSYHYILEQKFSEAESLARQGLAVDGSKHFIYANLAMSILLQGRFQEARDIYMDYKAELRDSFLDDINSLTAAGVIPSKYRKDVERIRALVSQ